MRTVRLMLLLSALIGALLMSGCADALEGTTWTGSVALADVDVTVTFGSDGCFTSTYLGDGMYSTDGNQVALLSSGQSTTYVFIVDRSLMTGVIDGWTVVLTRQQAEEQENRGEPVLGLASTSTTMTPVTNPDAAYTGGEFTLRVVATGDCQVVIRELDRDGETVFSGMMRSGDERVAQDAKRYWVLIGDPNAVQIYINDLLYESPHEAGSYYVTETMIEVAQ